MNSRAVVQERGDIAELWDRRHKQLDDLRSGGHIGHDTGSNEILYAVRLGKLITIIGDLTHSSAPLRVWMQAAVKDGSLGRWAVSGTWWMASTSAHTLSICAGALWPQRESYETASLERWRPPYLYDVVYSVDVLFHIMDDQLWERTVLNLGSVARWAGLLVISEHDSDHDHTWSGYQRTRALVRYRELLEPHGWRFETFVPYGFREGRSVFSFSPRRADEASPVHC